MADYENNGGYERGDINIAKIVVWGVAGLLMLVISLIAVSEYFLMVKEDYQYDLVYKPKSKELLALLQREAEELTSYKLIDEKNSVYRIPIARAMELVVDENSKKAVKR